MRSAPEASSNLAGQLRLATLRLLRRLRSEYRPDTLSTVQFSVLSTMYRHGGAMTPRRLAACEQVQPPTVTRLMKGLQDADLVTRRIHPTDRRQLILELTPAGNELLAAATKATDHWLTTHVADLTDAERATLTTAIPIINKIVNE